MRSGVCDSESTVLAPNYPRSKNLQASAYRMPELSEDKGPTRPRCGHRCVRAHARPHASTGTARARRVASTTSGGLALPDGGGRRAPWGPSPGLGGRGTTRRRQACKTAPTVTRSMAAQTTRAAAAWDLSMCFHGAHLPRTAAAAPIQRRSSPARILKPPLQAQCKLVRALYDSSGSSDELALRRATRLSS
ncbi:hypothetical protein B0H15DRAFT_379339 [Mycena belliarum]|uniref:Uncharacterized protein n=1 Tax=Mycena belliarum TaxID=1033014 RepID=A0AAD6U104_9AGAR|nr:hypothetical protein B0H15DRAFT_379339 [Mycena belliae]